MLFWSTELLLVSLLVFFGSVVVLGAEDAELSLIVIEAPEFWLELFP